MIFGYRDDAGYLKDLRVFQTREFPRMARPFGFWDPNICLTFASHVLDILKSNITIDDANTVYTIRYDAQLKLITIGSPIQGQQVFVKTFVSENATFSANEKADTSTSSEKADTFTFNEKADTFTFNEKTDTSLSNGKKK